MNRHTCDVIVNEHVFAAGISLWNLSRDGSQGDRLQLEENHQQHQGCVRLQRSSGVVSTERFSSEMLWLCAESEISAALLKVFLPAWALLQDQQLYLSEETHVFHSRANLSLRHRLTDWGPGDIFINEALHPLFLVERNLEEPFSNYT